MSKTSTFFILLILFCACSGNDTETGIEVEPGLNLELVVAEPLVIDPVAYAFDESGLLYVVEDRGYPDPAEGGTPAVKEGRIALLTDTNGDGEYNHRSDFAEGFTYPNGIMPWKGGVFITCSPDIWYLKDTTGDGKADVRQKVLSGFHDTRTAQIRMSHPTLGLDGWVYVSSGLNGGDVYSPLHPDRDTVSFTASDGRFDPETFEFENVGGKSQFGMAFDAYGHRFGVSNRHPIMQVVIEPKYLNRNPYLPYSQTVKNVSKVAAEAVVFPLKEVVTTSDFIPSLMGKSHQGTFTAASSTYIYYGKGLSDEHQGNAFICESAQNLMQRQIMVPDGPAFRSELAYEGREFLASEDEWFRPVYVNSGPEDGLYVVDMYRKVIDHPSYVPEEIRDKLDFESGKGMGRIYRITSADYPSGLQDKAWFEESYSEEELLERLASDVEWDRETAFRLLLERRKMSSPSTLVEIALHSDYPQSRVRALWLLRHIAELKPSTLVKAFKDPVSGIREQALLLSEPVAGSDKELLQAVLKMAEDEDVHVRFMAALVLGSLDSEESTQALAGIALRDGADPWMRVAVLSSIGGRMDSFTSALQNQKGHTGAGYALVMKDMGQMFGQAAPLEDCRKLASMMIRDEKNESARMSTMLGMMEGVAGRLDGNNADRIDDFLMIDLSQKERSEFLEEVMAKAGQESTPTGDRVTALSILGYTSDPRSLPVLEASLDPEILPAVQMAAIDALIEQGDAKSGAVLTQERVWKRFTPQVRSSVVSSMISHRIYVPVLLDAIEKGVIAASDVPSVSRKRLMNSRNDKIRSQAERAFEQLEGGDRMAVYEDYKTRLDQAGDPEHGLAVYKRTCAICHSYDGEGGNVGPDLTGVKNQPREAILMHTILPNYEVYPTYQTMTIETNDGRHVAGWTVSETENSITLRTAGGSDETILRSAIKELNNTGQSLMPDGLEQTMTEQEMNDLMAYLKKGSTFKN
ncbi:c-type cytochrome [Membranicola marinus]|uniref:C-type cytochrome n=1 Tax=Membranihabitans marinus TaxID=1227546 RepID=A0A953LBM0_9BACT|nr:PVC-type heme-binding CxxCH protein [Membranihabitans marinus]MBY5958676.1 c-type cytochrome [Membranihabitans marinus]